MLNSAKMHCALLTHYGEDFDPSHIPHEWIDDVKQFVKLLVPEAYYDPEEDRKLEIAHQVHENSLYLDGVLFVWRGVGGWMVDMYELDKAIKREVGK